MATMIFILVVFLHFAACFNLWQGMAETGWIQKDYDGYPLDDAWDLYVTQYYFMTTTMTTVGYGDFTAAKTKDNNMITIMIQHFHHVDKLRRELEYRKRKPKKCMRKTRERRLEVPDDQRRKCRQNTRG